MNNNAYIKICLGNLGSYNNCEPFEEWIDLPVDDWEPIFDRLHLSHDDKKYYDTSGMLYEEYFIADYDTNLDMEIDENADLDNLNYIATCIDGLDHNIVNAMYHFHYVWDCMSLYADDVICHDTNSMSDIAKEVYDELYSPQCDDLYPYIDFDAFGRTLDIEGYYYRGDDDKIYEVPDGIV